MNSVANTGLDRTPEGHRRCNGVSTKKGSFERMLIGQVQAEKKEEGGDLPCAGRFCFSAYPSTPRARLSSATPAVSAAAGRGPLPPTDRNCCHFIAMGIPRQGVHALRTVPRPGEREKKRNDHKMIKCAPAQLLNGTALHFRCGGGDTWRAPTQTTSPLPFFYIPPPSCFCFGVSFLFSGVLLYLRVRVSQINFFSFLSFPVGTRRSASEKQSRCRRRGFSRANLGSNLVRYRSGNTTLGTR